MLDPSGAVVPGVDVKAANLATGVIALATTNESGKFTIRFLLPGKYRLTAEKAGFKGYSQDNLLVRIDDTLDLTVRLEMGNVSETVEVKGGTPLLETSSGTIGQVLDERRMLELPQKGGNPLELQRMVPGVVNLTNIRTMKSSSPSGTSQTSVNGTGTNQTLYNIDGTSDTSNDGGGGKLRVAFIPPSAAIVGFKMESSPYDAGVGHVYGPVINMSTKGGSNELHGSAYYWAKNSAFDAMNFFSNKAGLGKLVYQDHRYGVSAGGPIFLPKLYNGRNRTFFFYTWEQNRWSSPANQNQYATVPTAAERAGDFSALLNAGSQYQIYNPFTTRPASSGRYQRDPLPGNIIPKSLLNTVGLNLGAIWPLPNQPGTRDGQNNYFYPDVRKDYNNSHMARVDHAFSANNRMFVRVHQYTFDDPKDALGIPATKEIFDQTKRGAALDDVMVLSPSLILNLRYGITNAYYLERRVTQGTDLAGLGFGPGLTRLVDPAQSTVPRVKVGGFATLSDWSDGDGGNSAITNTWLADLTKLKGSHSMRMGIDFRVLRTFGNRYPASLSPDLAFSTSYVRGPLDNATAAPIGQELAAMLFGIPEGNMAASASYAAQDKYFGVYFQDDFKVSAKLTLNLGLRYEMNWPVTERFDRLVAHYDFATANPVEAQAKVNYAKSPIPELPVSAFSARGGLTWVNVNGNSRSPYDGNRGHFLPRIGLAYQFDSKTVFRGGYGIYFDTLGVDRFIPIQTGYSQGTPMQPTVDSGVTYLTNLANPLPAGMLAPMGPAGGLSTNLGQALQVIQPSMTPAYSQRWSAGLQRTLPGEFLLDASYVASRGTHLSATRQINATPGQYLSTSPFRDQKTIDYLSATFPNPFYGLNPVYSSNMSRANLLRPFPQFGDISVAQPVGYTWYHSLQVRLEKRFSRGYTLLAGYTYSKFMQATEFLNSVDPAPYRVISDMDRPRVFTLSGMWELPFGRGRQYGAAIPAAVDFLFGGWQLDATAVRQGGAPLAFGNILFLGDIKNIPLSKGQRSADRWFNTDAGFEKNSKLALSSNLRTFPLRFSGIRADGQSTWSFSLIKNYRIREHASAQFRAECYNAWNHSSFDVPDRTPTSSTFGMITSTLSEPRGFQFGLKLAF
ncbi:MAG: carboxypeptidase-like regulatory domain-containing protein [Candidatus Solibacter sp.]|nr:carboxypeptidase-like regulatory domain-containing protein [Candidatus Solibacter sp.]